MYLSSEQIVQFERDGYFGPFDVCTPQEMAERWRSVRIALLDRTNAAYKLDSVSGATNIANYDRHLDVDGLSELVVCDEIVGPVAAVLGQNVICWRTEFFPKFPGDPGTDWHQADTFANASGQPQILWPDETPDSFGRGALTVWTALTPATIRTGCLRIVPGSHRQSHYDETKDMPYEPGSTKTNATGAPVDFFGYDYRYLQRDPNWSVDESKAVSLVMEAGQAVMFWSTLLHASHPNRGESARDYRMGYAMRFVPSDVEVYPNTEVVREYGGEISLERFGCVQIAGSPAVGPNVVIDRSLNGFDFSASRKARSWSVAPD